MFTTAEETHQLIEDQKLRGIIEKALQSIESDTHVTPEIKQAFLEERALRQRTQAEIEELLVVTQKAMVDYEKDIEQIKKETLKQIAADLTLTKEFNEVLKTFNPMAVNSGSFCTDPLKTNKLETILIGAQEFLQENFIKLFLDKQLPIGYSYETGNSEVTVLGPNKEKIYGNSKNTFFKTAILETYRATTKNTFENFSDLKFLGTDRTGVWIENTAMAHIASLPNTLELDTRFQNFSFLITLEGKKKFLYPHSGYAFGGDRDQECKGKVFSPEDCSSWMAKLTKSPIAFSTPDQLYHYRNVVKKGVVDEKWNQDNTPTPKLMENLFDVVPWEQDPQKYIQPGQIYCHRSGFDLTQDPNKSETSGSGGHTTLIVGFKSDAKDSKIVTIGYRRNMPEEEGFGIQELPLESSDKKMMIFSLKGKEAKSASVQKMVENNVNVGFSASFGQTKRL